MIIVVDSLLKDTKMKENIGNKADKNKQNVIIMIKCKGKLIGF